MKNILLKKLTDFPISLLIFWRKNVKTWPQVTVAAGWIVIKYKNPAKKGSYFFLFKYCKVPALFPLPLDFWNFTQDRVKIVNNSWTLNGRYWDVFTQPLWATGPSLDSVFWMTVFVLGCFSTLGTGSTRNRFVKCYLLRYMLRELSVRGLMAAYMTIRQCGCCFDLM